MQLGWEPLRLRRPTPSRAVWSGDIRHIVAISGAALPCGPKKPSTWARPLPSDARWWRYPTRKPPGPDPWEITFKHLDYRGIKTPLYPVYTFSEAERRAYRLEPFRGHYGSPYTLKSYPGETFRGHRKIKQTTFTKRLIGTRKPKPQRWLGVCGEARRIVPIERIAPDHGIQTICLTGKHRQVRPSFRYCWLKMLPWKPYKSEFKAFIRARSVHRTTRVIPSIAGIRHF
jgi:hypothetical protein